MSDFKYVDGVLTPLSVSDKINAEVPKAIEDIKREAKDAINNIRNQKAFSGIPYKVDEVVHLFGKDSNDITAIKINVLDIISLTDTYENITGGHWRSIENINVTMSESDFINLSKTITIFLNVSARKATSMKSEIDNLSYDLAEERAKEIVSEYLLFNPLM